MRNSKAVLIILVILLSGKNLYCQKIFRDGYVVKKNGDSLFGLVEYSPNQDIPSRCIFKRFDIAHEVKYTSDEILAFGYKNGNRYESKELNNKNLFYEVLVTGKIVLYQKGSRFYIDKDHLGMVELKNGSIIYVTGNGKIEFKSLPEFLNNITEGKSGTVSDRFNLKNDILPLITSYDKNSGKSFYVFNRSISEKQLSQKALETGVEKSRFGIISGATIYIHNLKATSANYNYLPDKGKATGLVYGLTYERLLSRKTDRFSLRVDVLYNRQTFYCYEENSISININRYDTYFNFTGIKAPVLFQYSFTGNRLIPYLNAGLAYQYIYNKSYLQIKEVENTSLHDVLTYEYKNMGLQSGEISAITGAGLRTRIFNNLNLNLQGRVEYGRGILKLLTSEENPFRQNSFQYTFLIGITF